MNDVIEDQLGFGIRGHSDMPLSFIIASHILSSPCYYCSNGSQDIVCGSKMIASLVMLHSFYHYCCELQNSPICTYLLNRKEYHYQVWQYQVIKWNPPPGCPISYTFESNMICDYLGMTTTTTCRGQFAQSGILHHCVRCLLYDVFHLHQGLLGYFTGPVLGALHWRVISAPISGPSINCICRGVHGNLQPYLNRLSTAITYCSSIRIPLVNRISSKPILDVMTAEN